MDCRQIIELLPWFLNGSLSPEEKRRVHVHLKDCDDCRAELGETLFVAKLCSAHPETAALVDLVFASSGADHQALEQHLAICPDCAEQVALLRCSASLQGAVKTPVPVVARRVARVWRPIAIAASLLSVIALGGWYHAWQKSVAVKQDRMAEKQTAAAAPAQGEKAAAPAQVPEDAAADRRDTTIDDEIAQLRRDSSDLTRRLHEVMARLAALEGLRFSGEVFDLISGSLSERGDDDAIANVIQVASDAEWVTFFLILRDELSFSTYELELLDADGEVLETSSGRLVREPEGGVTVSLPSSCLKAGEMTIRIYNRDGAVRREVESLSFEVVWISPG